VIGKPSKRFSPKILFTIFLKHVREFKDEKLFGSLTRPTLESGPYQSYALWLRRKVRRPHKLHSKVKGKYKPGFLFSKYKRG